MMAVMPVAMIGGPLIGGFITDHASLAVGLLRQPAARRSSSLFVVLVDPAPSARRAHQGKVVIDWWGAGLLSVWITSLVLAISWGGHQYPWGSWQILALFAVAVVAWWRSC